MLRNPKLTAFNERQIATALERMAQRKPLKVEMLKVERELSELARALEKRTTALKRFGFSDTHLRLSKLVH